jgi:hypothetical protein
MQELVWYRILDNLDCQLLRAQVFGGWLVRHKKDGGLTFVSDPELRWEVATRPAVVEEPPRVTGPVMGAD